MTLTKAQMHEAIVALTSKAGSAKSARKTAAARENGLLGGRPRTVKKCPRYPSHRYSPKTQRCPCGFKRRTPK